MRDADIVIPVVGAALTLAFVFEASRHGGTLSLAFIVAVAFLAAFGYGFLAAPQRTTTAAAAGCGCSRREGRCDRSRT